MPNIQQGNISVGGNLGMGYSTYSQAIYYVNPTAEFFVLNRLSMGGTVESSFS
jgi:hypothetical protein